MSIILETSRQALVLEGRPIGDDGPVHARGEGRFAKHADGKTERFER